ncbi:MAG: aminomethyl-transferring glycine dehydrogenase subunit GcvPA [Thaumarchaeota archaeon]|nr:aminomethyl-transferring glycine dehydrogenase subunit GcvPA [Nitrososphaerota archaeon]
MPGSHPLLPNLDDEIVSMMLERIGARSIDELFSDIPENVRLNRGLRIPPGQPESTVRRDLSSRLATGRTPPSSLCFLGGGVWPHYIPAVVESIVSRQEFYTSYTPYQPEISQGMLQGLFEYQSLMSDLLGMEACNSSMYDWASAAAEAARMAVRVTGRRKFLVAENIAPHTLEVIRSYVEPLNLELESVPFDHSTGRVDVDRALSLIDQDVAGIYLENPNYLGVLEEEIGEVVEEIHRKKGLAVVGVDPVSMSLLRAPGDFGVDIVVGEGQPLGIPMNYGGPHLGIFAVRDLKLARSMPGRLIGATTTKDSSKRAFSMVLQTREQHIRRESATSNICTNQSLMAIAASAYLALLGKSGFRKLGEVIISNSHYAVKRLAKIKGLSVPAYGGSFFKEFVVGYPRGTNATSVYRKLAKIGFLAGYPLDAKFGAGQAGLYCVTEVHTAEDIESLAEAIEEVL